MLSNYYHGQQRPASGRAALLQTGHIKPPGPPPIRISTHRGAPAIALHTGRPGPQPQTASKATAISQRQTAIQLTRKSLGGAALPFSSQSAILPDAVRTVRPTRQPGLGTHGETYSPWILQRDPLGSNYRFTRPVACLLSLVSGVSLEAVSSVEVQSRKMGQYRPWYSAYKGGGGITIGTVEHKTITYTENFFRESAEFNGHGYANDIYTWLSISAHEVRHLPQIDRAGGLFSYLGGFISQYTSSGSHDGAPLETDAELGELMFQDFYNFITHRYGKKAIERLLSTPNVSDGHKISRIREWWALFVRVAKPAVLGIAPGLPAGGVLR